MRNRRLSAAGSILVWAEPTGAGAPTGGGIDTGVGVNNDGVALFTGGRTRDTGGLIDGLRRSRGRTRALPPA